MSVVQGVAAVAYYALLVFFLALWARLILDLVQAFSRSWRPRGPVLLLAEASFTLTDPPIKAMRRVLPRLRIGGFALDFGFSVVMFAVIVLLSIASSIETA